MKKSVIALLLISGLLSSPVLAGKQGSFLDSVIAATFNRANLTAVLLLGITIREFIRDFKGPKKDAYMIIGGVFGAIFLIRLSVELMDE